MLVYNITVKVHPSVIDDWINWQKEEHIPEIMATLLFDRFAFFRLLDQDDSEGSTYVIQFYTDVKQNYDRYIAQYAPQLREKAFEKWGDRFISFRSLLESVQ